MSDYHCRIIGSDPDITLACGHDYSCWYSNITSIENDNLFMKKSNFMIKFSNNIVVVEYKLNSQLDNSKHKLVTLEYPYTSYKLHDISFVRNTHYLIELVIDELDKHRLIFVFQIISTPGGAKGPHYNGPVPQYFYLNKNIKIIEQISNYDLKELPNINVWFNNNIEKLLLKKKIYIKIKINIKIKSIVSNPIINTMMFLMLYQHHLKFFDLTKIYS